MPNPDHVILCLKEALDFVTSIKHDIVPISITKFANSESKVNIPVSLRQKDVYLIGWAKGNVNELIMNLFITINAIKLASCKELIVVLPMMPYARQDCKSKSREPITCKMIANIFNSLGVNHVISMDFHSKQAQGFFDFPTDNLYASPTFATHWVDFCNNTLG